MKHIVRIVVFFVLVVSCFAQNNPDIGTYPIMFITNKPLAVGTPVWANIGDNSCAYNRNQRWPIGNRHCFESDGRFPPDYQKARIKSVELTRIWKNKSVYTYTVEFVEIYLDPPFISGEKLTRKAYLDDAMKFYNLPPDLASYSQYFVLLNW